MLDALANPARQNVLLKTHGSIELPDSWILTEKHYQALLTKNLGYREAIKFMHSKTLLFLGYGLTDGDFEPVLEQLDQAFGGHPGQRFALMNAARRGEQREEELIRRYGIIPIWFDITSETVKTDTLGYDEVIECISWIVDAWARSGDTTPIDLDRFPLPDPLFVGRQAELELLTDLVLRQGKKLCQIIGFGGEGKTSLVSRWIQTRKAQLELSDFRSVLGVSLHDGGLERLIDLAFARYFPQEKTLSLSWKVSRICEELSTQKHLVIIDGLELIQDRDGALSIVHLRDIVDAARHGQSTIVLVSRIPVPDVVDTIHLGSLNYEDAVRLLKGAVPSGDEGVVDEIIDKATSTHALSLRVAAAYLINFPSVLDTFPLELSVVDLPDELDPRTSNKARRIIENYSAQLADDEVDAISKLSLCDRPVAEGALADYLGGPRLSGGSQPGLKDNEEGMRVPSERIGRLISTGLLSRTRSGETYEYLPHDLAKAFFVSKLEHKEKREYFGYLHSVLQKTAPATIESFEDIRVWIDVCRYAYFSENLAEFDRVYSKIIRDGDHYRLGFRFGLWDEVLRLVRLAFPAGSFKSAPTNRPGYYHGEVAMCLARLRQPEQAITHFSKSAVLLLREEPSDVSHKINNLILVLSTLGRFEDAVSLMDVNFAALLLIQENWKWAWQVEHTLIALAVLATTAGLDSAAQAAFARIRDWRASQDYEAERFYDVKRVIEIQLLAPGKDGDLRRALALVDYNLVLAEQNDWLPLKCAGWLAKAEIHRWSAVAGDDAEADLDAAARCLRQAQYFSDQIRLTELDIQVDLEALRLSLVSCHLLGSGTRGVDPPEERIIQATEEKISASGLLLYEADLLLCKHLAARFGRSFATVPDVQSVTRCARAVSNGLAFRRFGGMVDNPMSASDIPAAAQAKLEEIVDRDPKSMIEKVGGLGPAVIAEHVGRIARL